MLDIGRSGLLAYRTALAVTSENVANVGTEGYRRRDVSTVTAGGGQATPTTAPTGGQGVSVTDIRRAFDVLAADRSRAATAGQAAAQSHLDGVTAIETLMIPGDDGIDGTLRRFFDSISTLAGNPTDPVTRMVTLRNGEAVANDISDLARSMVALRNDMATEAGQVARNAQVILEELAHLSSRMGGFSSSNPAAAAAAHPLADIRDNLLDRLSALLPVSVSLDQGGRPTIRLGSQAGPLLLEGDRAAALNTSATDQLTLQIRSPDGTTRETRLLPEGRIGGLSRAMGSLDMAMAELDAFARTLADTMNTVHRSGTDLTGAAGGNLFDIDGWRATPAAGNGGRFQVVVTSGPTSEARQSLDLVYDAAASLWRAYDSEGVEQAAGRETLLLSGGRVDLVGAARDGDRISLAPVTGRALDLRWALTDPSALAAASSFATAASPVNAGTARLAATLQPTPASTVSVLDQGPGLVPVDLLGGVFGLIPAGAESLNLSSLGRPASTTLAVPAGAALLELAFDGQTHEFAFPAPLDATAIAGGLSDGSLRTPEGRSLASLGLVAGLDVNGALVLSRPGQPSPVAATLSGAGGTETGIGTPSEAAGGTIQIISRNGVHIAGAPLSAAHAANLLTPANGFLPGAVYDASPLTATDGAGYRGTRIDRFDVSALQTATLPAPAMLTAPSLPFAALPAREITLANDQGTTTNVTLPQGASAALIAERLGAALPGIEAQAVTMLELSGFAAGTVRFGLSGANGQPLQVSTTLAGTDATPLGLAINALSAATGIRAEVSPDGARLMLVQQAGHDISLSGLSTTGATGLLARQVGTQGQPLGPSTGWAEGSAIRQGGQVTLSAGHGFSFSEGMVSTGSVTVGSGNVTQSTTSAGAQVALAFADTPETAEGGLLHRISLGGMTAEAAHPAGTSGAVIAASLAEALRRPAPDAVLTGQPLAALPPDGSALMLRIDGASYTLRMEQGAPVISGIEPDRLTAQFDAQNRLVVTARGVTDGTGIGVSTAPAFGLGAGEGMMTLTGQAPDPAGLPATVLVSLAGTDYALEMAAGGGLAVPAGFPGTASRDAATGALSIALVTPADDLAVTAPPATGFGGPGVAVRLQDATLQLAGRSAPLDLDVDVRGALGQALRLTNLPPEDLIVITSGTGSLRLAGDINSGTTPTNPGALELTVTDASMGLVALRDSVTGHAVASGVLDASGRVTLGGLALALSGTASTGDRFSILPAMAGSADAGTARALAALRNGDAATGNLGLTERLTGLQADVGMRVAAAGRSLKTATATAEAAQRAQAAIGAVDLDVEAARLLELQQAYQANAQSMSVARDLFDTLLRMF
jgi:flagellar hook-associated protein 1 FlgK